VERLIRNTSLLSYSNFLNHDINLQRVLPNMERDDLRGGQQVCNDGRLFNDRAETGASAGR
jgi:hypothetical protein